MTMFLMIASSVARWEAIARFTVEVVDEADTTARPLAVLRMRAKRTATLSYFRADKLPDIREALVRRDFWVIPAPPLPPYLRRLAEEWTLTEDENFVDDRVRTPGHVRKAFFGSPGRPEPEPPPSPPGGKRGTLLLPEQYRSKMDWEGIRQALLDAKAVGIASDLVFVEADDDAQLDAILGAMDLCTTLRLRPMLRMQ
jgi:hypothetical protein